MISLNNINSNRRIDKWHLHQRSIRAKSRFYEIISKIAKPFSEKLSIRFFVKHQRHQTKIAVLKFKKQFGEDFVCPIINLPSKRAVRTDEAVALADKMFKKLLQNHQPHCNNIERFNQDVDYARGICAGIHFQIASRKVVANESLDSILNSLEKGGNSQAYALHILHKHVARSHFSDSHPQSLMEYLKTLQESPSGAFLQGLDVDEIAKNWDDGVQPEGALGINRLIASYLSESHLIQDYALIADQLGMKATALIKELGSSALMNSDEEYLSAFDPLKPGVYGIIFDTVPGRSHVITLIREEGRDTIVDANYLVLRSTNAESTKRHLLYVLNRYNGGTNHRLRIHQFKKA